MYVSIKAGTQHLDYHEKSVPIPVFFKKHPCLVSMFSFVVGVCVCVWVGGLSYLQLFFKALALDCLNLLFAKLKVSDLES